MRYIAANLNLLENNKSQAGLKVIAESSHKLGIIETETRSSHDNQKKKKKATSFVLRKAVDKQQKTLVGRKLALFLRRLHTQRGLSQIVATINSSKLVNE